MKRITSTDLLKSLSAMMDRVNEDHEPLLIPRPRADLEAMEGE
jgi:PHD/YefM family antitoxin component YafN of YafNO toxin-antitoxin module